MEIEGVAWPVTAFVVVVALVVLWKIISFFTRESPSSAARPEVRTDAAEDRAKKIRDEYRRREQRYALGEFDMSCPTCKTRCQPMRDTRTRYDCAKCDKQFEGPRHDF